jgi:hypothetical protein
MIVREVVTPVKTGVQRSSDFFKLLDSGFRRNDGKIPFPTFYEAIRHRQVDN